VPASSLCRKLKLRPMKSLFDRIEILKIQFENTDRDVLLHCNVCQGDQCMESTLIITFTDLNRVLAHLSMLGLEIDFSSFEKNSINYDNYIYEFDTHNVFNFTPTLENFEILEPYRQICA